MQTNLNQNSELIKNALALTGLQSEEAVIEKALRLLIQIESQKELKKWRG